MDMRVVLDCTSSLATTVSPQCQRSYYTARAMVHETISLKSIVFNEFKLATNATFVSLNYVKWTIKVVSQQTFRDIFTAYHTNQNLTITLNIIVASRGFFFDFHVTCM